MAYTKQERTHAANVRRLIRVTNELRKLDPQMELSQLLVYLYVMASPGMKVSDLLSLTGLSRSALSRNIKSLSGGEYAADNRSKPRPGHDLITCVSDPFDARAMLAAPTSRGGWLADKLDAILKNGEKNGTQASEQVAG